MNEHSSATVNNVTADIKLFNSAIFGKIEKAKTPALEFLDKIEILEKKYQYLLKSLGCNYDQFSFGALSQVEIENRDPMLPSDSRMDSFYVALDNLVLKIIDGINLLQSAEDQLENCRKELNHKIENLPKDSLYLRHFIRIKKNCELIKKTISSKKLLLEKLQSGLNETKSQLGSNDLLSREIAQTETKEFTDYLAIKFRQSSQKTDAEINTLLSQEKPKQMIGKLAFMFHKCKQSSSALYIAEGLVKGLEKTQEKTLDEQENHQQQANRLKRFR